MLIKLDFIGYVAREDIFFSLGITIYSHRNKVYIPNCVIRQSL